MSSHATIETDKAIPAAPVEQADRRASRTSRGSHAPRKAPRALRERLLMPVLFAPVFMVILDVFIVNVAAPSIRRDLHATASEVQWVVAAYLLTYAISLITAGRLGDVFGRRRLFRIGVAGFTVASALCAAAPSAGALIAGRLLQGFAGAAMWPQVLSIIQVEFAPAERGRVLSVQGVIQGLASVTGQIVGGGLIALDVLHLGWRSVFLINVPFGLLALAAAGRVVPESRSQSARKLDLAGVALATAVLALIMVPAVEGREAGWPAWVFAMLAAAVPVAAAFVAIERRIAARGGAPLAELRLFSVPSFRTGTVAVFMLYCVPSFFLLLSIYMQSGLRLDALQSGLAFTPLAVAFAAGSLLGPRVAGSVRKRLPQIGALTVAGGLISTIVAAERGHGPGGADAGAPRGARRARRRRRHRRRHVQHRPAGRQRARRGGHRHGLLLRTRLPQRRRRLRRRVLLGDARPGGARAGERDAADRSRGKDTRPACQGVGGRSRAGAG
jgi:EmrB/QacA subfamily drug resistance transporter